MNEFLKTILIIIVVLIVIAAAIIYFLFKGVIALDGYLNKNAIAGTLAIIGLVFLFKYWDDH